MCLQDNQMKRCKKNVISNDSAERSYSYVVILFTEDNCKQFLQYLLWIAKCFRLGSISSKDMGNRADRLVA